MKCHICITGPFLLNGSSVVAIGRLQPQGGSELTYKIGRLFYPEFLMHGQHGWTALLLYLVSSPVTKTSRLSLMSCCCRWTSREMYLVTQGQDSEWYMKGTKVNWFSISVSIEWPLRLRDRIIPCMDPKFCYLDRLGCKHTLSPQAGPYTRLPHVSLHTVFAILAALPLDAW
jgi:hypothetical protein